MATHTKSNILYSHQLAAQVTQKVLKCTPFAAKDNPVLHLTAKMDSLVIGHAYFWSHVRIHKCPQHENLKIISQKGEKPATPRRLAKAPEPASPFAHH